jgi:chromosome segregation ATPase
MSKNASKMNASATRVALYESDVQRLQREADNFTKELEGQKRKEEKLKSELEKETENFKKYKEYLRNNRPTTKEQKQRAANIKRMENQLEKDIIKYNQMVSENKSLRRDIDKYRKDKKAAEEIYNTRLKQKQAIEQTTLSVTKERNKEVAEIEDATMNTILIKSTYGKKKEEYNRSLDELKTILKARIEKQKGEEWQRPRSPGDGSKSQSNPVDIIKMRLDNWKAKVTHKKETLDMYTKHINIIRDAFDQIKKATGISNIQEIVVTFIKSQEQADALNNQLNSLDQELDNLEEKKANITKELKLTEVPLLL